MGIEELLLEKARKRGEKIGEKRERERAARRFVVSLLKKTDFSNKKIASLASVTPAFVAQVKGELKK